MQCLTLVSWKGHGWVMPSLEVKAKLVGVKKVVLDSQREAGLEVRSWRLTRVRGGKVKS